MDPAPAADFMLGAPVPFLRVVEAKYMAENSLKGTPKHAACGSRRGVEDALLAVRVN